MHTLHLQLFRVPLFAATVISDLAPYLLLALALLLIAALAYGAPALHAYRVAREAAAQSLLQRLLVGVLALVDDSLQSTYSAVVADLNAAKADGKVTPQELEDVAKKEWERIKALYTSQGIWKTLARYLGIALPAVEDIFIKAIKGKLQSPPSAPPVVVVQPSAPSLPSK